MDTANKELTHDEMVNIVSEHFDIPKDNLHLPFARRAKGYSVAHFITPDGPMEFTILNNGIIESHR